MIPVAMIWPKKWCTYFSWHITQSRCSFCDVIFSLIRTACKVGNKDYHGMIATNIFRKTIMHTWNITATVLSNLLLTFRTSSVSKDVFKFFSTNSHSSRVMLSTACFRPIMRSSSVSSCAFSSCKSESCSDKDDKDDSNSPFWFLNTSNWRLSKQTWNHVT